MIQQTLAGNFFTEVRKSTYKEGHDNDAQRRRWQSSWDTQWPSKLLLANFSQKLAKALTRREMATMHRSMQKHLQGRRRQHCTEAHESTLNEMTTLYRGTRKHFERNDNTAQRYAKALCKRQQYCTEARKSTLKRQQCTEALWKRRQHCTKARKITLQETTILQRGT